MEISWVIIALVSMFFSAFFSGSEIAYITSDKVKAEIELQNDGIISKILNVFYNRSDFFITTILVGNNIMLVIYGMGTAALIDTWLVNYINEEWLILIISTIISTGVILIIGEFFPKLIFRINPNSSMKYLALPLFPIYVILYPFTLLVTWMSKIIMMIFGINGKKSKSTLLSVGDLNQYLERNIDDSNKEIKIENEVKIFHNALDFSSNHLRDCMIPRNEIKGVNIEETDLEELTRLFVESGRSKIIVYKEDIDNILGYIHVSELFTVKGEEWKERIKQVIFSPESMLSNKMMRRLMAEKRSIAIVVDEFGGTAGMVTLEDLMEEILGDIQDEHDTSGLIARKIGDATWEFSARMEIENINETWGLELPETDDYQTLGGYILHETGTIPEQNVDIVLPPYKMNVLDKTANRLELIRVTLLDTNIEDMKILEELSDQQQNSQEN